MKKLTIALITLGLTSFQIANAKVNTDNYLDFYTVVQGNKIEIGNSKRYLESKLGIPNSEYDKTAVWDLDNDLSFSATFDEFGLSESYLSGSKKYNNSYVVAYGEKFFLNSTDIKSLEHKFNNTNRCLYEGWYEGDSMLDFEIEGGAEGTVFANFSSMLHSGDPANSDMMKQVKVQSISINQGTENLSEKVYCKNWDE